MRCSAFFQYALLVAGLVAGVGPAWAQTPDTAVWTRFAKKQGDDYRYGYQDARGRVRLPAKFDNLTSAVKFRHIIAVSENHWQQTYYLLKNGRQVGRDSVYLSNDYDVDCESEGAIRFQDHRKNRMGFFNAQGRVLIPARYNYVTPFHNGLAVALIGARRTCWGGGDTLHCEHPGWAGGRQVLLNQRNEVLADVATATVGDFRLNWYSLQRNAPAPDTATTVTLTGAGGERYTFTEYGREFRHWFFDVFVPAMRAGNAEKIKKLYFRRIAVSSRPFRGWPQVSPAAFMARYQAVVQPKISCLQRGSKAVAIGSGSLIFTDAAFKPFLTDCDQHFEEIYPIFDVLVTYGAPTKTAASHQEHFEFIRTLAGYRLFSISL